MIRRHPSSVAGSLIALAALIGISGCSSAQDIADAPDRPDRTTTIRIPHSSDTDQPPSTHAAQAGVADPPVIGDCYDTSRREFDARRDGGGPVDCDATHTAETFDVISTDGDPTARQMTRAWRDCSARFHEYVGAAPTVSTLGLTLLRPGPAQLDAGQGWIRRDVVDQQAFDAERGQPVGSSLRGILDHGVPDAYRACVSRWRALRGVTLFSSCQRPHQAELIPTTLNLGAANAPYPGLKDSAARSKEFCEGAFQEYAPETDHFYYTYPTPASWRGGTHDTTCWALDKSGDGLPPL